MNERLDILRKKIVNNFDNSLDYEIEKVINSNESFSYLNMKSNRILEKIDEEQFGLECLYESLSEENFILNSLISLKNSKSQEARNIYFDITNELGLENLENIKRKAVKLRNFVLNNIKKVFINLIKAIKNIILSVFVKINEGQIDKEDEKDINDNLIKVKKALTVDKIANTEISINKMAQNSTNSERIFSCEKNFFTSGMGEISKALEISRTKILEAINKNKKIANVFNYSLNKTSSFASGSYAGASLFSEIVRVTSQWGEKVGKEISGIQRVADGALNITRIFGSFSLLFTGLSIYNDLSNRRKNIKTIEKISSVSNIIPELVYGGKPISGKASLKKILNSIDFNVMDPFYITKVKSFLSGLKKDIKLCEESLNSLIFYEKKVKAFKESIFETSIVEKVYDRVDDMISNFKFTRSFKYNLIKIKKFISILSKVGFNFLLEAIYMKRLCIRACRKVLDLYDET